MFDLIRRKRFSVKIVFATFPCSGDAALYDALSLMPKTTFPCSGDAGVPSESQLAHAIPDAPAAGGWKALRRIGAFPYEGKVVLCFSPKSNESDEVEDRGSAGEKANLPNQLPPLYAAGITASLRGEGSGV